MMDAILGLSFWQLLGWGCCLLPTLLCVLGFVLVAMTGGIHFHASNNKDDTDS